MKVTEIYIIQIYNEELIFHDGDALVKVSMRANFLGKEYDIVRYYGVKQWDKIKQRGYFFE